MLAISEYLKSQGYAPAHEEHTRIPGIWKKLGTLYNLPALDERVSSTESVPLLGGTNADWLCYCRKMLLSQTDPTIQNYTVRSSYQKTSTVT